MVEAKRTTTITTAPLPAQSVASKQTVLPPAPVINQGLQTATSPVYNQQGTTRFIQEQPILDRVEKLEHIDVIQEQNIRERHIQDMIEVHEKPIERVVQHAPQQMFVQEQTLYQEQGREQADAERQRVLRELEESNRRHNITVAERQDVNVTQMQPSVYWQKEVTREVIEKPIVTEVHHQPITEVHEQLINKTIYESPRVSVIREAPVTERIVSSDTVRVAPAQHLAPAPVFVQTVVPQIQTVIIEKAENEPYPHVDAVIDTNAHTVRKL